MSFKITKDFALPYDYTFIPGGVCNNTNFIVRGKVQQGCRWFAVSLHNEANPDCDIALHFNPRVWCSQLVRNTKVKGVGWREEERQLAGDFPFKVGETFTLRIWVNENEYKILVDGTNLITFKHRMPYKNVNYVCIGGNQGAHHAEIYEVIVQNNCTLPFDWQVPAGLKKGKSLKVQGMVINDSKGFKVDFNKDKAGQQVACSLNVKQSEQEVVINSRLEEIVQEEHSLRDFPFKQGDVFDAQFIVWNKKMLIFVNDKLLDHYDLQQEPELINQLAIEGGVTLKNVQFDDPMPQDYIKEIPSGLENNDTVIVKGFFYPGGRRVCVNFMYGTRMNDDIALHFNPRRDNNQVVLNSRTGGVGCWDREERHDLPLAFHQVQPFKMAFVIKSRKFKCYVNDRWVCDFKARGKMSDIKGINVGQNSYNYEVQVLKRQTNRSIDKIPGQLSQGSWLSFNGTLKKKAQEFVISFQGEDKDMDIPFQMNPKITTQETVCNSQQQGQWGQQQVQKEKFPFQMGHQFCIDVLVLESAYRVFVDGKFYLEYPHRQPSQDVRTVQQVGDVNSIEPEYFGVVDVV